MKATVYFPPTDLQRDAWFASAAPAVIRAYREKQSIQGPTVIELALGLDAANAPDEMFDLSNNPNRQVERLEKYGNGRSVSVGDIIECEGRAWICKNIGWEEI